MDKLNEGEKSEQITEVENLKKIISELTTNKPGVASDTYSMFDKSEKGSKRVNVLITPEGYLLKDWKALGVSNVYLKTPKYIVPKEIGVDIAQNPIMRDMCVPIVVTTEGTVIELKEQNFHHFLKTCSRQSMRTVDFETEETIHSEKEFNENARDFIEVSPNSVEGDIGGQEGYDIKYKIDENGNLIRKATDMKVRNEHTRFAQIISVNFNGHKVFLKGAYNCPVVNL